MVFDGYRVTSAYGWRIHPIHKVRKFHAGIDLVKGHQDPIHAFVGGKVLYAGVGKRGTGVGGYGNVVVVQDSYGRAHVYCHLDSVNVIKGAHIPEGHVIGRQGATGQVTGSHLHYEVRKKSSPYLGWTINQENSTLEPREYLENFHNIEVDGYWGKETTKALQRYLGTVVDGIISNQYQNNITEQIGNVDFGEGGSLVIKALQELLGVKQDGYFGPITLRALQSRLGTPVDGVISRPSLMVKELQRRLNAGKL